MFANKREIFGKVFFRMFIGFLVLAFIAGVGVLPAFAQNDQSITIQSSKGDSNGSLISIDMVDVDVRDVLSVIALNLDVNIIYLDTASRISFKANGITAEKALELLVQTIGNGVGYIKDKNLIVVGNQDKLKKDFFNEMALTRFRIQYITPTELSKELDTLGVPVQKITMDKSSNFIWAQGTPQALAKVASVITALDRQENFKSADGTIKSNINLTPLNLEYLTADRLEQLIQQLDIKAQTIKMDSNPKVLWVNGSQQDMVDINQLIAKVDIPESAGETFEMNSYKMKYLTYDKLIKIASQLKLSVEIITAGSSQKALWLKGTQKDIKDMESLISELDIPDNSDECQYFFYTLKYLSPTDASTRLGFLSISGVTSMTMNYPQLSHEILIKCPFDMIGTVSRILGNIDVSGQKIKLPVDSSSSAYQLTKRRELLSRLLSIPLDSMTVSDDVSKDGTTPHYVLWVEGTSDNIKKIRDMIDLIDNP